MNNSPKLPRSESTIFGVSLRGIIAIEVVTAALVMAMRGTEIKEPVYSLITVVVGFYFGHAVAGRKKNL